ncbi:MAG: lipopolysaccharide heptosyltransferase II [Chloroflexota bacterium]
MNKTVTARALARSTARYVVRLVFYVVVGVLGFLSRARRPARLIHSAPPRRILVVRLDLLGDITFSMPAVAALRCAYPNAGITMLTLPYSAPLASMYRCVDEIIPLDTNAIRTVSGLVSPGTWLAYWKVFRELKAENYDLAVSMSGQMASLWSRLSGASTTIGFAGEAYPFILTNPVPGRRYEERKSEVDYGLQLAAAAGASKAGVRESPHVPDALVERMRDALRQAEIGDEDEIVAIHPGAGHGSAKRWPAANWAAFADRLQTSTNTRVVLVGGAFDRPIAQQILAAAKTRIVSLVGDTTIGELCGLLQRANLVASSDSGPLHIAAALNRPVLGVYGPTDPAVYGPMSGHMASTVLRRDLPCSPCYTAAASAECPLGDPICMRLVPPKQMVDAALRLLAEPLKIVKESAEA